MTPRAIRITIKVVLAAGAVVAIFVHRSLQPEPRPVAAQPTPPPLRSEVQAAPNRNLLALLVHATPAPTGSGAAPAKSPELKLEPGFLTWEKQLQAVLQEPPSSEKGAQLLALLPTVPEEAYAPVTEQALDWLADTDYTNAALPLLLNANTHGAVLAELYRDIIEHRPPGLSLPALLTIARTPEHPYAGAAHETLAALMGEDLATDWNAWESAIKHRIAAER